MKTINVGFVIDDNYVKYLSVTIISILENKTMKDKYVFHVIHDGSITKQNQNILSSICSKYNDKICFYPQNKQLHHEQRTDTRQDIPAVTNYRLMISSILNNLDKIIFMDADLICLSDLSELWDIDLDNYYLACCPGQISSEYIKQIGIPNGYSYCNTGVMLADLKKWRENNIETLLFASEKKYRGIYQFYDQCIFNIALFDKIKYLPQRFNYRPAIWEDKEFTPDFTNPCILHWAQPQKPWQEDSIPYAREYFKYADKSAYKWNILKLLYETQAAKASPLTNIPQIKKKKYLWGIITKIKEQEHRTIKIFGIKIFTYNKAR